MDGFRNFELPPRDQIQALDPEIAGEGARVDYVEELSWNPPPPQPVMPDWSKIKSIRHYFGRTGYQVYPATFYHENGEERIARNAEEARALGVWHRKATDEEKGRYGINHLWDWVEGSKWRPKPWHDRKFDPKKLEQGKNYIQATPDHSAIQTELMKVIAQALSTKQVDNAAGVTPELLLQVIMKMAGQSGSETQSTETAKAEAISPVGLSDDAREDVEATGEQSALNAFVEEKRGPGRPRKTV